MLGKPIRFQRDGATVSGVAEDVGADGALLVRAGDGQRLALLAGEVEQIRFV
jgi:biotin-(acetyl-CoA carboxylase) ligase